MSDSEKGLIEMAKSILQIDSIDLDTKRSDIEQWDSLAHVMLISEVESFFHKAIPFEDISKIECLYDFIKYK